MVRCKANWLEYGEKNSKYFHALEKHRFNQRNLKRVQNENQEILLYAQKEVLDYLSQFFKNHILLVLIQQI